MHTACVWSEKLPFAGYSVVKDHSGGIRPAEFFGRRGATSPGPPSLAHSRGPDAPLPFARVICQRPFEALSRTPTRSHSVNRARRECRILSKTPNSRAERGF